MLTRMAPIVAAAAIAIPLLAPPHTATGAVVLPVAAQSSRRLVVEDDRTVTRTLRFGGSGARRLEIRLVFGSIRVTGTDDTAVQIEARRHTRAETDAALAAADREVALEFSEGSDTVAAVVRERDGTTCGEPTGRREWRQRSYQVTIDIAVRIPRGTALYLCTINGGEIRVDRTDGDFTISNVNGRITMEDVRGSGVVETVNGPISVSFREPPAAPSRFKTLNGDVTATFPAALSADLRMKTFNGGLYTDFEVVTAPGAATVDVERRGGMSVYRSNDFTRVRAGNGGPELTFETFNGDVRIRRATR